MRWMPRHPTPFARPRVDERAIRLGEARGKTHLAVDQPRALAVARFLQSVRAGLGEIWNASNAAFALCWLLTAGQIHALDAAARIAYEPSSRGVAIVRIAPRSVPASGSVRFIVPVHSPDTSLVR
jgi:hypothetical protein